MDLFDIWSLEKKRINAVEQRRIFIKPRTVWFLKMGKNIGHEIDGKGQFLRPVIVLSQIGSMYWVVPLTSQKKEGRYFYSVIHGYFGRVRTSVVLLSQARVVDKRRFVRKITTVCKNDFKIIIKKMRSLYFSSL